MNPCTVLARESAPAEPPRCHRRSGKTQLGAGRTAATARRSRCRVLDAAGPPVAGRHRHLHARLGRRPVRRGSAAQARRSPAARPRRRRRRTRTASPPHPRSPPTRPPARSPRPRRAERQPAHGSASRFATAPARRPTSPRAPPPVDHGRHAVHDPARRARHRRAPQPRRAMSLVTFTAPASGRADSFSRRRTRRG